MLAQPGLLMLFQVVGEGLVSMSGNLNTILTPVILRLLGFS
jgi:hypothetical protein